MALKFLNKKGWHTGSLRNLENVWKAEQKHDAEQKKLEELRAQLHKEREAEELRQLHIDAGLAPKQDRLEFLYDSGLGVGGGASASSSKPTGTDNFTSEKPAGGSAQKDSKFVQEQSEKAAVGALFQETKQSANDKWRKIHSDPLYLIKQQELAALDRIRKNPVRMQMLESEVRKRLAPDKKSKAKSEKSDKHHKKKKKHKRDEERDDEGDGEDSRHKKRSRHKRRHERRSPGTDGSEEPEHRRRSPEASGSGVPSLRRRSPEIDDSGERKQKRKNPEMSDYGEYRRKRRSPEIDDSGDHRQKRKNPGVNDYGENRRKRRSPGMNDSDGRPRDDSPRKRHKSSHVEMGSTSRVPKRQRSADSDDILERSPPRNRRKREGGSDDTLERNVSRKRKHGEYGSSETLEKTDSRRRKHRRDSPNGRHGDTSYDRSHGNHYHERRDGYRHRNDSP